MNGGAGKSGDGYRVPAVAISTGVRTTIDNIKVIASNHSDEEVYAMIRECSMDPNETCQKLLLQDTFHEMKRRRDKKKENLMAPIRLSNNRVEAIESLRQVQPSKTLSGYELTALVNKTRGSINDLSFELVASKFQMPIAKAAKKLKISETTLSLWCRLSAIPRWPYRKLESIDSLITTMHKFGRDKDLDEVECTIKVLEEKKLLIMREPSRALQSSTLVLIKKMQNLVSAKRRTLTKNDNKGPDEPDNHALDIHKIQNVLGQAATVEIMTEVEKQSEVGSSQPARQELSVQKEIQRGKMSELSFELVAPKFEMPIELAAKQLRVNKSTLQLWCRINDIPRWPYRKIQSIKTLLTNVQEFGCNEISSEEGTMGTMQKLKEEKRIIKENPSTPIQDSTLSFMRYMTQKT